MPTDHEFITRSENSQCPRSSDFRESAGKLVAVFSHQRKSSQDTFFDRDGISSGHQTVQGKGESFFRFSDLEEAARTFLEEQRDHHLTEVKSEILKQECKVDTLNTCIREFQRQAHSNRLELDRVSCGYEESKRAGPTSRRIGSARKSLRDTRIRSIHEVEELNRAQEMRIDEFSRHELRESHAAMQELTSQIQDLQERMIISRFLGDFQDVESICSGNCSRSQSTRNCSKSWWNAEPRPKFVT